jgi:hypothetical protein
MIYSFRNFNEKIRHSPGASRNPVNWDHSKNQIDNLWNINCKSKNIGGGIKKLGTSMMDKIKSLSLFSVN